MASANQSNFIRAFRLLVLAAVLIVGESQQEGEAAKQGVEVCDRERSRLARELLNQYLFPLVDKARFRLDPQRCRLHPEKDMFLRQEEEKVEQENGLWQCRICRKMFREEQHIDKHMGNRHPQVVYPGATVCLADLCDILHCDAVERAVQKRAPPSCQEQDAQRRKHLCQALSEACFPPDQPLSRKLNEFFQRQFCDAHTCQEGRKLFPEDQQKRGRGARYFVLAGLGALLLALFYAGLFLYQRDMAKQGKGRLFSSRHAARLLHLRKHKKQ
eukprot:TRINITY_DN4372_c0_g2_i1.p1 TRINITY_DN4372_c0_g2~~TRINITY_DN4372_c0_g2_i1.p1  ORF type:complete len:272 (-),score=24.49 TRINITY_DN4372_c0_g2_i1:240-1055(-)